MINSARSEYWNPKTETLPRDELSALQLSRLRILCAWAAQRSPFYAKSFLAAGFCPSQLRSKADVQRIPLLSRQDWMRAQDRQPPYGDLLTCDVTRATRLHTTSGTSGAVPLRAVDDQRSWAWIAEMWCYGLWGCGVRRDDLAYVAFGYGSFIGFWGLHYALEKIGALTVPGGAQPTASRVRQITELGATVVASTPTYAIRMAHEARQLGIDLAASAVRTLILSGEPAGSIPRTKALIESLWGARAYDTAGMTEVGSITTFECSRQPGGTHIIEDHVMEEVLSQDSLQEAAYGETGERVVTSFGRGTIPLIRYRSADLVRRIPADTCGCGRGFDLYEGGILGRADDMLLVRGTNVYPASVEAIVREFPRVTEFQTDVYTEDGLDQIRLRVELASGCLPHWPQVKDGLHQRLRYTHEGLNFAVELASEGELPRFELKAKRMTDLRTKGL
ncbi:phenylacetate--CoA ligase family protein [Streptomyces sp. NPDC008121]|uniref:phenylacetate--CoA ligase family protein n=1 Tax=Streptomyces sp. NPDC008121 TaxID=3364809 RepID=UPI0036E62255